MVRVYATGMGPLPWEKPRFLHGSCARTWQLVRPMLDAGHEVCLVALRVFDAQAPSDLPLVQKTERDNLIYILADEGRKFNDPGFHQSIVEQFRPEALLAITTPACKPFEWIDSEAPLWADIHGYVMGEAQIVAELLEDNRFVGEFWKRYDAALYRADCFSTTSRIQRHTLIGELGALGRLSRYNAGYEFVYSIPIGRSADEIRHTAPVLRGKVVPRNAFILLWLGGYNFWCDPHTLFEALEGAMRKNERIHYVSTGGKIDGVNEITFQRFRDRVEKSSFRERYHFQGWVDSDDIPNYLSEADAGINVDRSCYESVYGARHRITEMLRAGLPVITTRITEVSRELARAEAGLTCPPEDPQALAKHILDAAEHPAQLMEMGIRGRELFLSEYTDEVTTRPLLDWLQRPEHAPDWGKEIPRREHLLHQRQQARPLWQKVKEILKPSS